MAEQLPHVRDAGTFDYVIAGGGTAGCALAARLSEDPDVTVCLLEAGPSDVGDDNILVLSEWMHLLDSGYDWDYPVEPQERGNCSCGTPGPRCSAGCSSHNSCIAFLAAGGVPRRVGGDGRRRAGAPPRSCRCTLETTTSTSSTRSVARATSRRKTRAAQRFSRRRRWSGMPTVAFNRGETVRNGAGWFQINAAEDGTRMSTLARVPASDPGLPAQPRGAHRLLGQPRSCSTTHCPPPACATSGRISPATTPSRRGARSIVTAGAIDTPKLLMLSGIGPERAPAGDGHRRPSRLPGRRREPRRPRRGPGVLGGVQADGDDVHAVVGDRAVHHASTSGLRPARPDDALRQRAVRHEHAAARLPDDRQRILPDAQRDSGPVARHGAAAQRATSATGRGSTRATSPTPRATTTRIMLTGVRLARKIAEQAPLAAWVGRELAPGPGRDDRRRTARLHPQEPQHRLPPRGDGADGCGRATRWRCSTRSCGSRACQRLRVVDASAMPKLPAVNPNITVMTMAEKCADLIRAVPDTHVVPGRAHAVPGDGRGRTRRSRRRIGAGRFPGRRRRRRLCETRARRCLDGPQRAGDAAGERRRHHDRHRRAGRHLRLHPAAHRRRNGIRGACHGAEHADPAPGCRSCGPSSPNRRVWRSWRRRRGTSSRADRPTIAPATDSRPVGELVHGDVLLVGPDVSVRDAVVPDDRAPRVLCADPAAGRRTRHLHRSRPADQGGRRRCLDRRADHPGDERARPARHRGSDGRDRADGHAGVRPAAHAGRDVTR